MILRNKNLLNKELFHHKKEKKFETNWEDSCKYGALKKNVNYSTIKLSLNLWQKNGSK